MNWHHILHCPMNDLPCQTLSQYAVRHQLTDTKAIPGHLAVTERRAEIDTLLVLRRSFRSMLNVHRRGLSLAGQFTADNFIVDSELSVRLHDILLTELRKETGDQDYYQFVKVVLDEVFVREQVPRGILRWLRVISNGLEVYGNLIPYHSCVMEHYQAIGSHMSLYRKFLELERTDSNLFYRIISGLDKYKDWKQRIRKCNNTLMDDARVHTNPVTTKPIYYHDDVRGPLKLVRHCWQHPALLYEGYFTLIVGEYFPWLLADFQESMYDAGQVGKLHLYATMQ